MKLIKKNLKKQELTIKPETIDDLWMLSQIIETGDLIKGRTERKIKIGENTDRNIKVVKKQVFLSIIAEKIELADNTLRVLGVINDGPDDIPRGEHHSFKLEINDLFTIVKEKWLNYQLEKINEAQKTVALKILIVISDREEAFFAKLKGESYNLIATIKGDVQKKESKHVSKNDFYKEISKKLTEYDKTDEINHIILASPGFWKENLLKELSEEIKKKSITATVSQASERAIPELMKRPELQTILEQNRATQEIKIIDKLLENISKDSACYGVEETKEKIGIGAVSDLLISFSLLRKSREQNSYKLLERMMINCEQAGGKIHIISSEEAKKTLDSLTGIAGILRWKS